jgi:hypothetical protein
VKHDHNVAVSLWLLIALSLVFLARGLPPRSFVAGDSGVKLIAVRNALSHPTRPLDIDLPSVGGQPVEFVDPFFRIHGDHAHAVTSEMFPLLTAPLVAAFGIRGLFILPAVGFLLILAAVPSLGRTLDPDRSAALLVLVTAVTTPFLFYALEFWEHTLAVGIAALGTALLLRQPRSIAWLLIAGVLFGMSALLRPEAAWFVVAVLIASRMLNDRFGARDVAAVLAGVAAAYSPWMAYSIAHSGQLVGTHVAGNLSGASDGWGATRLAVIRTWFKTPTTSLALVCGFLTCSALGSATVPRWAPSFRFVALCIAIVVAAAAANRAFPPEGLWCAAPLAMLALAAPFTKAGGRRFLWTAALVSSILVLLTTPNDGGAQWGPRYLLFAFVPLAILIADVLRSSARSWRVFGAATATGLVIVNLLVQRNAYKELQGAKRTYERLVAFTERETPPGSYIVTDLWWLDQVTAALYPTRTMLFAAAPASAERAIRLLADANVPDVSIIRSREESSAGTLDQWLGNSGFRRTAQADIADRTLTIYHVERGRSLLRREPQDLAASAIRQHIQRAIRTLADAPNPRVQFGQ